MVLPENGFKGEQKLTPEQLMKGALPENRLFSLYYFRFKKNGIINELILSVYSSKEYGILLHTHLPNENGWREYFRDINKTIRNKLTLSPSGKIVKKVSEGEENLEFCIRQVYERQEMPYGAFNQKLADCYNTLNGIFGKVEASILTT